MLLDFRTGQCIGPCAPSFATLPPAAPYAPDCSVCAGTHFASLPSCIPSEMPRRGRNLPRPLHRLPMAPPLPRPCSANCANVRRQRHSPRGRRTKVVPNSQPGAAALETSNLMALLPSRLLSVRRRPAVLLTGTLAWTADLRPGRPRGITAPRRLRTGIGTEPSPDPQVQISSILQNRSAAAVDTGAPPGQIGMPNPPPPAAFHPHPGYQGPPPAPYGYGSWNVGMSSWQSIGGQQHGQDAQFPKQPPQPLRARHDRKQAQAPWHDPQHLRSRRQGYHEAWAAKRREAAAAANSPSRVKAAAELLPREKPQLYAVDMAGSEDLCGC